jgi:hypothetical protein
VVGGIYEINAEKVLEDAPWDGMHAIATSDRDTPAEILLSGIRSARSKAGLKMASTFASPQPLFLPVFRVIAKTDLTFNSQRNLIDIAVACIAQIERLGNYEFNYQVEAVGETDMQFEKWVSVGVMQYTLCHDIARVAVIGDIFARLKTE